jgi:predicted 3-demethylubiquinone-9 3-methyltransferase (glyoxalase superfamily)
MSLQKITPHLWFDKEAKEAAEFHVKLFGGDSALISTTALSDTPSGDAEVVNYTLLGYQFMAISAGPFFKINPSLSFIVNFDPTRVPEAKTALETLWVKLAAGGTALMPLGRYPFSDCYGWVQDKFGVSWQLILSNPEGGERPAIVPALMFTQKACGQAEAALKFYTSVFKDSRQGSIFRYGRGEAPEQEGTLKFADFMLQGQWFAALDSAQDHNFTFNEGASLVVHCETQGEIDYFWAQLSAVPQAEQCGWLKDRFGVSWQVVPSQMAELLGGTPEQRVRVTQAFLKMKKFDIATLEAAYAEKE